jgi:hypothetical protein
MPRDYIYFRALLIHMCTSGSLVSLKKKIFEVGVALLLPVV